MKKILIVDDNENFLEVLSTLFISRNFEVVTQQRGTDILEIVQNIKPDFVLLDIFIGKSNGLDIYKAIKANIPTSKTPVLLMSGSDVSLLLEDAIHVIAKPFDFKLLIGRINTMAA